MDQKTRKLITRLKALHLRGDMDYMRQVKKHEEDSPALKIV